MSKAKLDSVLAAHSQWLCGDGGGRADLGGADLRAAYLRAANLSGANLIGADLGGADLSGANLSGADLGGADLGGADLRAANLGRANLGGANLRAADLGGADLPDYAVCPPEGSFLAYKKVNEGVITLEIPAEARRTSSLIGRKCRAEFVRVLEGGGCSTRGGVYVEGKVYRPDSYDDDIRVECSNGVHFFVTRREAEAWQ